MKVHTLMVDTQTSSLSVVLFICMRLHLDVYRMLLCRLQQKPKNMQCRPIGWRLKKQTD